LNERGGSGSFVQTSRQLSRFVFIHPFYVVAAEVYFICCQPKMFYAEKTRKNKSNKQEFMMKPLLFFTVCCSAVSFSTQLELWKGFVHDSHKNVCSGERRSNKKVNRRTDMLQELWKFTFVSFHNSIY
jgi:hypothetical protein